MNKFMKNKPPEIPNPGPGHSSVFPTSTTPNPTNHLSHFRQEKNKAMFTHIWLLLKMVSTCCLRFKTNFCPHKLKKHCMW